MNWLKSFFPSFQSQVSNRKGVPEGVWQQCGQCQQAIYHTEFARNLNVCSHCGHHHSLAARTRIESFLDANSQHEIATGVLGQDWLGFRDTKRYKDRLSAAQKKTQEEEALLVFHGTLKGMPVVVCAFEFSFIGGSMGSAVGEKFVQAVEAAIERSCPLVAFVTSGGARMQEGLLSLLQMSKTAAALAKLAQKSLPYICVLTHPTTGGVSASLATLGDIIIAEPNALIAFAGPRVIEQTVKEVLPDGFQRSEFLLKEGAIDMIVPRGQCRDRIAKLVAQLTHQMLNA